LVNVLPDPTCCVRTASLSILYAKEDKEDKEDEEDKEDKEDKTRSSLTSPV
jgi:hypothetical protein